MREVTLWHLIQTKGTLDALIEKKFTASVTFQLMEVMDKVNTQLEMYQKTLQQTLSKHGANDTLLDNPDEDRKKYTKIVQELEPLLNRKIQFENINITKEDLSKVDDSEKFSVNELMRLKWLFTPVEEVQEIDEREQKVE